MKILLINDNPVVSRLTALSARKEEVEIDEIQEVTELSSNSYDIVFVDADSWTKDVRDVISEDIKAEKLVLFYAEGDEEEKSSFDLSILKPFLPSEVSAVIRSIEGKGLNLGTPLNVESKSDTFDEHKKIESKEELFDLDGLDIDEEKKEEPFLPKEDKIDFNLDDDLDFDDKLEEAFPLNLNTEDDDLKENKLDLEKSATKSDEELFKLDLNDEIPSLDDDLFTDDKNDKKEESLDSMVNLFEDDKKEESSNTLETLELDIADEVKEKDDTKALLETDDMLTLDIDEKKVEEKKEETKILDSSEIENIKDILTDDNSNDMVLEDLMPAMAAMPTVEKEVSNSEKVEKKKKEEKKKEEDESDMSIDSNALTQTLTSMPVETLRELLAGSKINIKIKFPKSK